MCGALGELRGWAWRLLARLRKQRSRGCCGSLLGRLQRWVSGHCGRTVVVLTICFLPSLLALPYLNRHVDVVVLLVCADVFGDAGPIAAGTEGSRCRAAVPVVVS
jgi:hypothetical protein